jgi:hypothetical protein
MIKHSFTLFIIVTLLMACGDDKPLNPVLYDNVPETDLSAGILRPQWRHASMPAVIDTAVSERAHVSWSNPVEQVPITDIWNRDIGQGESNSVNVLGILFQPVDHKYVKDLDNNVFDSISYPIEAENSWAGFMRTFNYEQFDKAQFLEFRLKGDEGIMHIDIGRISEDIDGNGLVNTEDPWGYRTLDPLLDNGLDMLPDSLEFGYDPDNGVVDPAGDNWDGNDIWHINGTEGNRNDPDGGNVPDNEDPDYNGLELTNSYFSYRIDLSDTTNYYNGFYVDSTRNDKDWRTLRIPMHDPLALDTTIGAPSWNQTKHMRIWFDSAGAEHVNNPIIIQIAAMQFRGTGWHNATFVADSLLGPLDFSISFINEGIDLGYDPPPGVEGTSDQSLVLEYSGLNAGVMVYHPDSGLILASDTGKAERILPYTVNLTDHRFLEVHVHGDMEDDSVMFFFRMGAHEEAYYEYRTILKPGWDSDNKARFDVIKMEVMKNQFLEDRSNGIDSSLVRRSGKYSVKVTPDNRAPNVRLIKYFAAGVVNLDKTVKADGEIWIHGPVKTGTEFVFGDLFKR